MKKIFILLFILSLFVSCTDEQMAKNWGGTATVELPENVKLINVTWKENDDLWLLTRKMKADEKADTLEFFQHTGKVFKLTGNGKVVFIEKKTN